MKNTHLQKVINKEIPQKILKHKRKKLCNLENQTYPKKLQTHHISRQTEMALHLNHLHGCAKEYENSLWGANSNFLFTREETAE